MEILYIYLHQYRNLSNQGVNITAEFNFTTEVKDGVVLVGIKKNGDFIPNFFHNTKILGVSAIIGQNGAGKSNILEFIRNELPTEQGGIKYDCIVAMKSQDESGSKFQIYISNRLDVRIEDETKLFTSHFLSFHQRTIGSVKIETFDEIDELADVSFIFYSNHLDLRYSSSVLPINFDSEVPSGPSNDFFNISTLAMLSKDQQNYTRENYSIVGDSSVDKMDAYKAREIGRGIDFISKPGNHKLLHFTLPESLLITIQAEDERQLYKYKQRANDLFNFLEQYQNDFNTSNLDGQIFINLLCRAILFNFFRNNLDLPNFPYTIDFLESKRGDSFFEFFIKFFTALKENDPVKDEARRAGYLLQVVNYLYELLIKESDRFLKLDERTGAIRLPVEFSKKQDVSRFIGLYVNSKGFGDYLNFQWRGLSTGEQSMLTLLSRFYSLSDDLAPTNLRLASHVIILIDEGDVYFHPEWQRKYLQLLLNFLPDIFGNRTIQIVLTSNTPYLASDLPKSNITFLRKQVAEKTKVLPPDNDRKETFASNIHTLLANSFFLENGLIGEFATVRINDIIDFVKSKGMKADEKRAGPNYFEYKKTLELIGEPIIKNRLLELWVAEFGVEEEIDFLRKRIDELSKLSDR